LQTFSAPWSHDSRNLLIAHYFNWFKTPDGRGSWHNWEWQGDGPKHNPNNTLANDRRDIASVYYPLIGPYDSSSPAVMEYHMLTALAAKIDGFFIDWYGIPSEEEKLFPPLLNMADRYGFKMCICFEDKAMFGYHYGVHDRREAVSNAILNLNYILDTHAKNPAYLRIDGVPVVINFNWQEPSDSVEQHAEGFSPEEWAFILTEVRREHQVYFVHDYHCHLKAQYWDVSDNMYPWPDVNGVCLDRFYERAQEERAAGNIGFISSLVYPGFDNTGVWGWGEGPTVTEREDGAFYERSWMRALSNDVRFLQIATWNDFGEGATIEPTLDYGYQYLEITERFAARLKKMKSDGGAFLRIPLALYRARVAVEDIRDTQPERARDLDVSLDTAAELFAAGDSEGAQVLIDGVMQ